METIAVCAKCIECIELSVFDSKNNEIKYELQVAYRTTYKKRAATPFELSTVLIKIENENWFLIEEKIFRQTISSIRLPVRRKG